MPPQDRGGLNDSSQTEQARPQPGHPNQQRAITAPQPETWRSMPQGNVELMTEKQVLRFKPAPRLEQIGDISSKQVDDRKHRIGYCADSASPRESTGRTFRERQVRAVPFVDGRRPEIFTGADIRARYGFHETASISYAGLSQRRTR
jgi:hypothetical protein